MLGSVISIVRGFEQFSGARDFLPTRISIRQAGFAICILLLVVWFGNFFEFEKFTFYADDWAYYIWTFNYRYSIAGWLANIVPYADGRPIQLGLIDLTSVVIQWNDSLAAAYLFLFLVTCASVLATWWALSFRFSNAVALIASIVFAISPLVSIRPFLNGIALPMSFLFLMIATIVYISGWKILSYLLSILILLTYEMIFPLFALLPALLQPLRTRRDLYRLVGHIMICGAMIAIYALLRSKYGSGRLGGAIGGRNAIEIGFGIIKAVTRSVMQGGFGSINLHLWFEKIVRSSGTIIWGLVAFVGFILVLRRQAVVEGNAERNNERNVIQALILILFMVPASYALTYFGDPNGAQTVLDRASRFHIAATLPFSILTGLILIMLLRSSGQGWLRRAVIVAEAGFLGVLVAFSISHQDEFAFASERQRLLLTQLAMDHPMMDPQATFIIRFSHVDTLPSIDYQDGHSYYFIFPTLLDFGGDATRDLQTGPKIRIVANDQWQQTMTSGPDGQLNWPPGTWPPQPGKAGHIWYYEFTLDGVLRPLETPILIGGRNILHEGPDNIEGAVDIAKAKRHRYFDLVMGSDAVIFNSIKSGGVPPVTLSGPAAN